MSTVASRVCARKIVHSRTLWEVMVGRIVICATPTLKTALEIQSRLDKTGRRGAAVRPRTVWR
jgi:hypothetical protein